MVRLLLLIGISCVTLTACDKKNPVDENASAANGLPDVPARAPTSTGEPHVATVPADEAAVPTSTTTIPAAFQGRWGLAPADCTSTRGDAKGLLVVDAAKLQFYESRAVPTADVSAEPLILSGKFEFTGEGQSWTKYEALKIDRNMLVRTETNPTASFTYAKCS